MKILGYEYEVERKGTADEIGGMGKFLGKPMKIQIATDQCREQEISTLIHEALEALNYHLALKLEHNVLMSLEAGIYQVLVDNGVDLEPLRSV